LAGLGSSLTALADLDGAEDAFTRLIAARPDDWGAKYSLGNVLYTHGKYAAAEARFRECIHLNPTFPQAHYNLALCLSRLKDPDGAAQEFAEAHRLDPKLPASR
jgi:tetratricopeptide (TPR) repeat protein